MGTHQVYLNNETEQKILALIALDETLPKKINLAVAVIAGKYADEKLLEGVHPGPGQ